MFKVVEKGIDKWDVVGDCGDGMIGVVAEVWFRPWNADRPYVIKIGNHTMLPEAWRKFNKCVEDFLFRRGQ